MKWVYQITYQRLVQKHYAATYKNTGLKRKHKIHLGLFHTGNPVCLLTILLESSLLLGEEKFLAYS